MKIKILNQGDRIKTITSDLIAIERSNGEMDIYKINTENKSIRIDKNSKVTIGYKENNYETKIIDGVTITTF